MKIPKHIGLASKDLYHWKAKAEEISMEYGVYVEVIYTNRGSSNHLEAIQFKILDHVFEGVKDLRKALENKAFL